MADEKVLGNLYSRRPEAERTAQDRERTSRLLEATRAKSEKHAGVLRAVWSDFWTLWRLVRAWRGGEYRNVPWKSIILALAGLIYFLDPIDIIPDFIPVIGYLDDGVVLTFIAKAIHSDLERFRDWERTIPAM
ncbi:MAG: YkvA family protein [Terriglobales bacterium]|jgi:uncharacterized membrane protein YkvA (DUF1232 family)